MECAQKWVAMESKGFGVVLGLKERNLEKTLALYPGANTLIH